VVELMQGPEFKPPRKKKKVSECYQLHTNHRGKGSKKPKRETRFRYSSHR
jgi:hypothetical protein